jgi:DNA-binding MarR family transcriptional regulator
MVAKARSPSTAKAPGAPSSEAAQSLLAAMGAARGDPCFCALARRASRGLTELYERELEPYGITLPQFSLLRATGALGPIGISDLAARLKLDRTTLGRNLKLLEKMGLVAMDGNSEDQRERLVRLTPKGSRLSEKSLAAWQAAQAKVKRGLSKEKLAALQSIVADIDALAA